jgi:hypothetical protein
MRLTVGHQICSCLGDLEGKTETTSLVQSFEAQALGSINRATKAHLLCKCEASHSASISRQGSWRYWPHRIAASRSRTRVRCLRHWGPKPREPVKVRVMQVSTLLLYIPERTNPTPTLCPSYLTCPTWVIAGLQGLNKWENPCKPFRAWHTASFPYKSAIINHPEAMYLVRKCASNA